LRVNYRDLIALVEFGDEAYVVTPFTTDYENILLSLSLVGDKTEFMKFPDQGTTIGAAMAQSIELFRAFDFLDAAGNLMVIFSDGQDTQVKVQGKPVSAILSAAVQTKIPVYFIRVSYNRGLGAIVPTRSGSPPSRPTGGRFYPAADESAILNAIRDIDRRSAGRVEVTRYSSEQPRFTPYALLGAGSWRLRCCCS